MAPSPRKRAAVDDALNTQLATTLVLPQVDPTSSAAEDSIYVHAHAAVEDERGPSSTTSSAKTQKLEGKTSSTPSTTGRGWNVQGHPSKRTFPPLTSPSPTTRTRAPPAKLTSIAPDFARLLRNASPATAVVPEPPLRVAPSPAHALGVRP